jgi:hypothetical protein
MNVLRWVVIAAQLSAGVLAALFMVLSFLAAVAMILIAGMR